MSNTSENIAKIVQQIIQMKGYGELRESVKASPESALHFINFDENKELKLQDVLDIYIERILRDIDIYQIKLSNQNNPKWQEYLDLLLHSMNIINDCSDNKYKFNIININYHIKELLKHRVTNCFIENQWESIREIRWLDKVLSQIGILGLKRQDINSEHVVTYIREQWSKYKFRTLEDDEIFVRALAEENQTK